jgi:putative flippase GtrA
MVDFAVLNSLMYAFGTKIEGGFFALIKLASFSAAVINSYYLNKYWVFNQAKNSQASDPGEGVRFGIISVIGFLLNVAVSSFIFASLGSINSQVAANIGALFGTLVVLIWNYTGYKFFVFKFKGQTQ